MDDIKRGLGQGSSSYMAVHPIILCGGAGVRLWPASTAHAPKPFMDLMGGRTLFQRTVARVSALPGAAAPVIVTGVDHVARARSQLQALGIDGVIIAEPEGRDSGPALLAAALWIARTSPSGMAVAVASDHHIPDEAAFAAAIVAARPAAEEGRIVVFGVRPGFPATGYGYIRPETLPARDGTVQQVARFVEKPALPAAESMLAEGCLWNSGNLMFQVGTMIEAWERHAPEVCASVRRSLSEGRTDSLGLTLGPTFLDAPSIAVDIAILEKTDRASVLPVTYAWSDLGAWDQVWAAAEKDLAGNAVTGICSVRDSGNCLIRASAGSKAIAIGVTDLAIVIQDNQVLVTALARAGDLKPALAALEVNAAGRGRPDAISDRATAVASAARLRTWLFEDALPLWWCFGADHMAGGYYEALGQDLRPSRSPRRARVQARQVHVFALAGLMGWNGPWPAAIDHGLSYLVARYRRDDGLFRASVGCLGECLDDTAFLYDQAFVLLAQATAAQALPARRDSLKADATALLGAIEATYRCPNGGYRADDVSETFLQNPMMHLFEAALAWLEVDEGGPWKALAAGLVEFVVERLLDANRTRIPEVFDRHWAPLEPEGGRITEPGHLFEWSWLLERWWRRSGDRRARAAALSLFVSGADGVDPETGLVLDVMVNDAPVSGGSPRLWPQAERLKAALLLASVDDDEADSRYAVAKSAAEALQAYLDTFRTGLWRDGPKGSSSSVGPPALASSFYHIAGAIYCLDRTASVGAVRPAPPLSENPSPGMRAPDDAVR